MPLRAWRHSSLSNAEASSSLTSANLSTCTLIKAGLPSEAKHAAGGFWTAQQCWEFDHATMHPVRLLDPLNFSLTLNMGGCQLKIHFWYNPSKTYLLTRENGNLLCRLRTKDHFYCSWPWENTAYNKDKAYLIFVHKADVILFGVFRHYNNEKRTSYGY